MDLFKEIFVEQMRNRVVAFHRDQSAATATEYIILLILVACFVIAIVKIFGKTVYDKFWAADEVVNKEVKI